MTAPASADIDPTPGQHLLIVHEPEGINLLQRDYPQYFARVLQKSEFDAQHERVSWLR